MTDTVNLEEFTSSGEVFINGEGNITIEPMQLFKTENGQVILRIGNNTYWFYQNDDKNSHYYDGPEFKVNYEAKYTHKTQSVPGVFLIDSLMPELLAECAKNRGKQPDDTYFSEGSSGFDSEIR